VALRILVLAMLAVSCGTAAGTGRLATEASTDRATELQTVAHGARFTVLVFLAKGCHCLVAHSVRLASLAGEFEARGVRFVGVDTDGDGGWALSPFAVVPDPRGRLAREARAEYAGHAVVVGPEGTILYCGGIDSDRVHLTEDATPYLRNALEDLLLGRAPRVAETKALGCALRIH
jgi:hypothetical protein